MKGNHKHGLSNTRIWRAFNAAKNRCTNPKNNRYALYGGRGILFEWGNFQSFLDDMYESFKEHVRVHGESNTLIERIDNNGNYCKGNCRWASRLEQANNKSDNYFIEHNGETKTAAEWARGFGIPGNIFWGRIKNGWSFEEASSNKKFRRNGKVYESY